MRLPGRVQVQRLPLFGESGLPRPKIWEGLAALPPDLVDPGDEWI